MTKHIGNIIADKDLKTLKKDTKSKVSHSGDSTKARRIIQVPKPEREIDFSEWRKVIYDNFPDLVFPAEVALSMICQILILDVTNPFALVFVDAPSSGKTICINFFSEIEGLTYATDKFSPASFVSNAANVSKKKLERIDMLPKIRYKMFLLRDLATMFSKRDDDLAELMGTLTRVLDGDGLNTDSGVHGGRKYVGEYLFMMLAGSTPLQPKVWRIMGNLGSRLFFLNLNTKEKTEAEIVQQLKSTSHKEKEKICRRATRDFLYTLWHKYPEGIRWDIEKENDRYLAIGVKCATLLSRLRGTINVSKANPRDIFSSNHITTNTEKPYRIARLFHNLCRGHALACGRNKIGKDDLRLLIDIAIDSAPVIRGKLFRELVRNQGKLTTGKIEEILSCSKPTALKEMKAMKILGVCEIRQEKSNAVGNPEKTMYLAKKFDWFLSDECRNLKEI